MSGSWTISNDKRGSRDPVDVSSPLLRSDSVVVGRGVLVQVESLSPHRATMLCAEAPASVNDELEFMQSA
jgi:hypothetical protein